MREPSGSFKAYDDDGQEYTIVMFARGEEGSNGGIEQRLQMPRLQTSDRRTVNWLRKGKYRILDRHQNIVVTSNDPNAI
jgi:hypothetical protein